ncbi:MAG: DUF192 domain-containing protein [Rhodospirillales bacterium]
MRLAPADGKGDDRLAVAAGRGYSRIMTWTRRAFLIAGLAAAAARGSAAGETGAFPLSRLAIETARGRFVFDVEVADTAARRTQGLQGRRALAPNAGMLFDFGTPQPVSMWMKNTPLPLDMLFVGEDGVILNIAADTVPFSLVPIVSAGPALAVLEVAAGTAARLGVRPGDRVRHPIFAAGTGGPDRRGG